MTSPHGLNVSGYDATTKVQKTSRIRLAKQCTDRKRRHAGVSRVRDDHAALELHWLRVWVVLHRTVHSRQPTSGHQLTRIRRVRLWKQIQIQLRECKTDETFNATCVQEVVAHSSRR